MKKKKGVTKNYSKDAKIADVTGVRIEAAKRSCVINFMSSFHVRLTPSITTANILKAAASFVSRPVRH